MSIVLRARYNQAAMRSITLLPCAVGILLALTACQITASRPASGPLSESVAVYFNNPLAGLPEMEDFATQGGGLDQVLIELIEQARSSLDIAMYHLTMPALLDALQRACARRVTIRLVLEAEQSRPQTLPHCVQLKLDENERLMHHKFMIVDQRTVWTGSTNWTETGVYFDANNAVIIQSSLVAQDYRAEFEEMFSHRRYGPTKQDTNEERLRVSDVSIEIYFSPSDRPRERLIELIKNARQSIRLALYDLTDQELYEALLEAQNRGVRLEAIWDLLSQDRCFFSRVDDLLKQGIGVVEAGPGLLHHKYAIIDDRIVITGSANWSKSALERNDENFLIVHDEGIAQRYRENFQMLLSDARAYEISASSPPRVEIRHFGVARDAALIQWRPRALGSVERYEICRLRDPKSRACERSSELPGWSWYFIDRPVIPGPEYFYRVRSRALHQWTEYSNAYRARIPEGIPILTAEEAERELKRYLNQRVTVRFRVVNPPRPTGRDGHIYLNSGEDYKTDFTAFIPACALERFTGSGLDLFGLQGRLIEVTGELTEYNGPEIFVTGPWQIQIAE